jgi:hypothetical protein
VWKNIRREKGITESTYHVFLKAFLRLEVQRIKEGVSWFECKVKIHRVATIVMPLIAATKNTVYLEPIRKVVTAVNFTRCVIQNRDGYSDIIGRL